MRGGSVHFLLSLLGMGASPPLFLHLPSVSSRSDLPPAPPPVSPGCRSRVVRGVWGHQGVGGAGCWRLVSPNGRCRLGRQQATLRKRGGNNFGKGGAGCGHAGLEAGRPRPSSRLPPPAVPGAVEPWRCPCPCRCRYRCWCWCWGGSWRAAGPGPSRARPRGSGKGAPCSTGTARAASLGRPSPTTAPTSASASWRRGRRSSPARMESWVGVYTVKDCYPVQETYTKNYSVTTSTRFFDLQLGIADPSVFTPPSTCQTAQTRRMKDEC
uniref:Mammalian ependymin-related protein 1 n=1 Tax=Anas platyrhynchos platyrhynchos TaxID=8840 RepID=A0A493TLM2_ANAPP